MEMMNESACVAVWPESDGSLSGVCFGEGVYIGKDVEIAAIGPGSIQIGEHTSFQDRCQIYGDIRIGAHCIFARNILVISTSHQFRKDPAWLIHDQDQKFLADMTVGPERAGYPICIEDDCWLGWGCAVMPGVYVGRGAVIGANSVVTRDVAPYEVHGGAPNRALSVRLPFDPPREISALDDRSLPYFYRGFRQERSDLARSRPSGGIAVAREAVLVLAHDNAPLVRIQGRMLRIGQPVALHVYINGQDCGEHVPQVQQFELTAQPAPGTKLTRPVPAPLLGMTFVELLIANPEDILICGANISSAPAGLL